MPIPFGAGLLAAESPVERLVFASCHKEHKKAPALKAIADWKPDVFVWMGDNIYGDSADVSVLRAKYEKVANNVDYLKIREDSLVLGTWDDHDYGANDAGKEFKAKVGSQQAFLDFLQVPEDSPRRNREGVYSFQDLGPKGKQVRLIFLDTRYHRDKIGSDGTILGKAQWQWLVEVLQGSEAQVNIIISSIQVLASEHRFEKWSDFETERELLFALLRDEESPPVLILSGDRHRAEISLDETNVGYPLYEITSSGLNCALKKPKEVNSLRIGENYGEDNFGTLVFDWKGDFPGIRASICDEKGGVQREVAIFLRRSKSKTD